MAATTTARRKRKGVRKTKASRNGQRVMMEDRKKKVREARRGKKSDLNPRYETELITPAKAEKWLETMVVNRPLNGALMHRYAAAMKAGEWKEDTGETIKFNEWGELFDGQKRLTAIIRSRKPQRMLVARGLPAENVHVVDTGQSRSVAHQLAINGEKSYAELSTALRVLHGFYTRKTVPYSRTTSVHAIKLLKQHGNVRKSVYMMQEAQFKYLRTLMPRGVVAGLHYIFSLKSKRAADKFVMDLATGQRLGKTDPVYKLRERMIQNKISIEKLQIISVAWLMLLAWNARRTNNRKWEPKLRKEDIDKLIVK